MTEKPSLMENICVRGCGACPMISCCFHPAFAFLPKLTATRGRVEMPGKVRSAVTATIAAASAAHPR